MRVSEEQVAHTIRFPYVMHKRLKELAEDKNRSFNSQIVWLLKRALKDAERDAMNEIRREKRHDIEDRERIEEER